MHNAHVAEAWKHAINRVYRERDNGNISEFACKIMVARRVDAMAKEFGQLALLLSRHREKEKAEGVRSTGENYLKLVERYADGRALCNCRGAYLTNCGDGIDAEGNRRTDMPTCEHGCSANLIQTKEYIADRVVEEMGLTNS